MIFNVKAATELKPTVKQINDGFFSAGVIPLMLRQPFKDNIDSEGVRLTFLTFFELGRGGVQGQGKGCG